MISLFVMLLLFHSKNSFRVSSPSQTKKPKLSSSGSPNSKSGKETSEKPEYQKMKKQYENIRKIGKYFSKITIAKFCINSNRVLLERHEIKNGSIESKKKNNIDIYSRVHIFTRLKTKTKGNDKWFGNCSVRSFQGFLGSSEEAIPQNNNWGLLLPISQKSNTSTQWASNLILMPPSLGAERQDPFKGRHHGALSFFLFLAFHSPLDILLVLF